MISTDALQVGFLTSFTIVNEGVVVNDIFNEGLSLTIVNDNPSLLTIVNETTNFKKTIVLKNDRF